MINVTATFSVREGQNEAFEQAVAAARPHMLADEGCLRYDLQRVGRSTSDYVLLETYDSAEAIRRHGELEAFAALNREVEDLLAAEPVITVLKPVGEQVS
ncbi:antibiotic biosynthesis monooxygenase [Aeromicrobium phragmitis]|uniref:Antibiotic biosynthesis monooxygenase n=1 Tax=Aeromicrobium phragmitis TaxID=2478914 RepID=A0A3L8PIV7_9ACTN|nr:putative quinol monooxygenase [Aeromicrobium phragmitis]RLV55356.1 antibiotic biosynthesis monooxygenase [Aeromicrobium phragmitis]